MGILRNVCVFVTVCILWCVISDTELDPYTSYEYRIGAWNSFGRGFSPSSRVTTKEDAPWGVSPLHWSHVGLRDDIIQLEWSAPNKPNGNYLRKVVLDLYYIPQW